MDDLRILFLGAHTGEAIQLSAQAPVWVEIAADVLTWSNIFKVAAATYLTTLAKHLAEDTWKNRNKIGAIAISLCGEGVEPLRKLFASLK